MLEARPRLRNHAGASQAAPGRSGGYPRTRRLEGNCGQRGRLSLIPFSASGNSACPSWDKSRAHTGGKDKILSESHHSSAQAREIAARIESADLIDRWGGRQYRRSAISSESLPYRPVILLRADRSSLSFVLYGPADRHLNAKLSGQGFSKRSPAGFS